MTDRDKFLPLDLFTRVMDGVPDYQAFKTVAELDAASAELAARYPDRVTLFEAGRSREGRPIQCLKIGRGRRRALLFGFPHPNEPIGSLMLDYLAERLAGDPELAAAYDLTWYIVKCADPDGAGLNEGWFKGPFTPLNYALHWYRPAGNQQVEWTFPIDYKTLHFSSPIPETRALMRVIDEAKPDFVYSLHNAGFGGVYFYISGPSPELYRPFQDLARAEGLPLALGEPEMPYAKKFADAIYEMPGTRDTYDYLAKFTGKDPAALVGAGTSSVDYAKEANPGAFVLVCEMPYFYEARVDDTSASDMSRREAILACLKRSEEEYGFIGSLYEAEKAAGRIKLENSFRSALEYFLTQAGPQREAQRQWAESSPDCARPATVAEKFDNFEGREFYELLIMGLARRLFLAESEAARAAGDGAAATALAAAAGKVEARLRVKAASLEAKLDYEVIPIRKLVRVQLGSALLAAGAAGGAPGSNGGRG